MALEPYRPPSDNRYRDELDREIDQKIDTFFHRWNWKLTRFVRRAIIVVFVLWVAANAIPSAVGPCVLPRAMMSQGSTCIAIRSTWCQCHWPPLIRGCSTWTRWISAGGWSTPKRCRRKSPPPSRSPRTRSAVASAIPAATNSR